MILRAKDPCHYIHNISGNSPPLPPPPKVITIDISGIVSSNNYWYGGVLHPNGRIYSAPGTVLSGTGTGYILEINPSTSPTSVTVHPINPGLLLGSGSNWTGCVLAPNGNIYVVPRTSRYFLEITPDPNPANPPTIKGYQIDTGTYATLAKWMGGVLAPNGNIYCIPYNNTYATAYSDKVLEIIPNSNPSNPPTWRLNSFPTIANYKWCGGVLGLNGHIYGFPQKNEYILEIIPDPNPANPPIININTISDPTPYPLVDPVSGGSIPGNKYQGGSIGLNGKMYGIPMQSPYILEMTTNSSIPTTNIHYDPRFVISGDPAKWFGGVTVPNGKIYGIPNYELSILEITPTSSSPIINTYTDPLLISNSWNSGVLGSNGIIYCMPNGTNIILEIDVHSVPDPADTVIPTNLSLLPTSKYNAYYNNL